MNIAAEIFRAYDVRGIVGKTLTAAAVRAIGQALGTLAIERGAPTFALGRDGRLSGPELSGALADGLNAAGANVIDVGLPSTRKLHCVHNFAVIVISNMGASARVDSDCAPFATS